MVDSPYTNYTIGRFLITGGIVALIGLIYTAYHQIKLNYYTKPKFRKNLGKYKNYKPKYDFKIKLSGIKMVNIEEKKDSIEYKQEYGDK